MVCSFTLTEQQNLPGFCCRTNTVANDVFHHNSDTQSPNRSMRISLNHTMKCHVVFVLLFLQWSEMTIFFSIDS